ncbi:hypothetical protein B2G47_17240 [Leptospira interrogans serovar Canicola]|nr:hypothetical protein B2G47_17240 [Leptospira interrogans serovar Canicola]
MLLVKHLQTNWKVFVFFGILFCKPSQTTMGNNPYYQLFRKHPITQMERYFSMEGWEQRISGLNSEEQNFVQEMNRIDGITDLPEAENELNPWKERLSTVRKSLPNSVNTILDRSLFKVILCKNLGSSGLSSFVYDNTGPKGGVVFLDTKLLNQTANEWITQKENSPFISGNIQVKVRIESDTKDKIETAIEYILLHEVGHILSVLKKIVPDFREEYRNFSEFEFSKGIWKTEDVSYLDSFFPLRKEIKFYTSKPIELSKNWDSIYPTLEKTPFPTLYSATNADDFFADSFVSYVHTKLQKKTWNLEIFQNKKRVFKMKNGIQEPRCKVQKEYLDNIFSETF